MSSESICIFRVDKYDYEMYNTTTIRVFPVIIEVFLLLWTPQLLTNLDASPLSLALGSSRTPWVWCKMYLCYISDTHALLSTDLAPLFTY
jgi:hypothetical protein